MKRKQPGYWVFFSKIDEFLFVLPLQMTEFWLQVAISLLRKKQDVRMNQNLYSLDYYSVKN